MTSNLEDYGYIELEELISILTAMKENGLPDGFSREGVRPKFNQMSGSVYLVNDDFQVCMVDVTKEGEMELHNYYECDACGQGGFREDLEVSEDECCVHFIKSLKG